MSAKRTFSSKRFIGSCGSVRPSSANRPATLTPRVMPALPRLVAVDVVAAAALEAIAAMRAADPDADEVDVIGLLAGPDLTFVPTIFPLTWKAKQAALSTLGVTVTVAQEK